jgi:hypothetical protein
MHRLLAALITITLSWQLAPEQTQRQEVYRQINCTGAWVRRATVSNTTVEWTDVTTKPGMTYCYYVDAVTRDGKSGPSNIVSVTVPLP